MAKKPPFRIAHLSDLHLTPSNNIARTEVSLPGSRLKGMNNVFRKIMLSDEIKEYDSIIITGDITDTGGNDSWNEFKKILDEAQLNNKTWVIAGNHDICDMKKTISMRDFFETISKDRQKKLLERLRFNLGNIGQPVKYPWARIVDKKHKRAMVIGVDTNHSGHFYLHDNAKGCIGWKQLTKLEKILKKHDIKEDKINYVPVKIVAIHHSPNIPRAKTMLKRSGTKKGRFGLLFSKFQNNYVRMTHEIPQEERRAFRDLCKKYKVRLVMHGHMHEAMDRYVDGLRILGAPATTQPLQVKSKQYQFYEYTVLGNGGRVIPRLITLEV